LFLEVFFVISVENKQIGEIPLLHLARTNLFNKKLPLIIFIHGFTSAKEHNLHYAYLLAEKGFRVVLPDCLYHGARQTESNPSNLQMHFWEIVLQTVSELEQIKVHFEESHLIDSEKIGVVGTSMGGIVTLGALTKYPWIHSAVSLMGMPYYEKLAFAQIEGLRKQGKEIPLEQSAIDELFELLREKDLSLQPEKLMGRPLLFWHGKKDHVVPYSYAYEFYESIRPLYELTPEYLHFITDEKADHKVSREGVLKTVEWFEQHLLSNRMIYVTSQEK
jgi:uncharacterized protein